MTACPTRRIVERLSAPHYGSNGDPLILVAQGSSRDLNPSLPQAEIDVEYDVDVAQLQVKIAEAGLYPTLALQGSVQQLQLIGSEFTLKLFNSAVQTRLTVPFYRGGSEYSAIRESKEAVGHQRLNLDQVRDQVRANVVQYWGQLQATKAQTEAAERQVKYAESALDGLRDEARIGQRTTLDVLNAIQALLNARVSLITAQHDRVVASYNVLSAARFITLLRGPAHWSLAQVVTDHCLV